jgi:hypothetical protein
VIFFLFYIWNETDIKNLMMLRQAFVNRKVATDCTDKHRGYLMNAFLEKKKDEFFLQSIFGNFMLNQKLTA